MHVASSACGFPDLVWLNILPHKILDIFSVAVNTGILKNIEKLCLTRTKSASFSETDGARVFLDMDWLSCPHFQHWEPKASNILF